MRAASRSVLIEPAKAGHVGVVVRALCAAGWLPVQAPAGGRLQRNRQEIVLNTPDRTFRLRLLVFKITRSSRGREHERRVEITSTYGHGIEPTRDFDDVVIGYDPELNVFVGLDPERLRHGGKTANASSFLEQGGLRRTQDEPFLILVRQTKFFPDGEQQAFFRPERLSEYLQNVNAIHAGSYPKRGILKTRPLREEWASAAIGYVPLSHAGGTRLVLKRSVQPKSPRAHLTRKALMLVDEPRTIIEKSPVTPEELRAILQVQEQNGFLGEEFVYLHEIKILRNAGREDLARKVKWVSRRSVGEGYDIKSFDPTTGDVRYIEVKSASAKSLKLFDISKNEWDHAARLRGRYFIYCVSDVRGAARIHILRDPVALERAALLRREPSSWRVRIVAIETESCHGSADSWD